MGQIERQLNVSMSQHGWNDQALFTYASSEAEERG